MCEDQRVTADDIHEIISKWRDNLSEDIDPVYRDAVLEKAGELEDLIDE